MFNLIEMFLMLLLPGSCLLLCSLIVTFIESEPNTNNDNDIFSTLDA